MKRMQDIPNLTSSTNNKFLSNDGSKLKWTLPTCSVVYRHEFTYNSNKIQIYSNRPTITTYDSAYGGWSFGSAATTIYGIEYYDSDSGQWFGCVYNSASSGNQKYICRLIYLSSATTPLLTTVSFNGSWTAGTPSAV